MINLYLSFQELQERRNNIYFYSITKIIFSVSELSALSLALIIISWLPIESLFIFIFELPYSVHLEHNVLHFGFDSELS